MYNTYSIPRSLRALRWHHDETKVPRHPICALLNGATACVVCVEWMITVWRQSFHLSQHIYFATLLWLYLCSTMHHTLVQPKQKGLYVRTTSRYLDQDAIARFICITPLPFVAHDVRAVSAVAVLATALFAFKYIEHRGLIVRAVGRRWYEDVSLLVFLCAGVVSLALCLLFAESTVTQSWIFWSAAALFATKLLVYKSGWGTFSAAWTTTESGHTILLCAVALFSYLVVTA